MAFRKMERYIVSVKIPKFRGIRMQESLGGNRNGGLCPDCDNSSKNLYIC